MSAFGTGWGGWKQSAPIDPAYLRFVDGVRRYWGRFELPEAIRWHPREYDWHTYKPPKSQLLEVGIADGPRISDPNAKSYYGDVSVDWWDDVRAKYASVAARYPNAVWNPQTGEWFNAVVQGAVERVPVPPGTDDGIPDWLRQEIENIRASVRAGIISPSKGSELISDKVTEWFNGRN